MFRSLTLPLLTMPVLVLALPGPARALDCKTAVDQASLNQCADRDFKAADAELNTAYGQVAGRLAQAPDVKSMLLKAQRSWLAFRDAECAFRTSGSTGGSMHPMDQLGCLATLTRDRTAVLRRDLSCKPEDSDCPAAPTR